jgi:hypothetical protein
MPGSNPDQNTDYSERGTGEQTYYTEMRHNRCIRSPVDVYKSLYIQGGRGMWHVWGRGVVHRGVWWVNLTERDHFEDRRKRRNNMKMDIQK